MKFTHQLFIFSLAILILAGFLFFHSFVQAQFSVDLYQYKSDGTTPIPETTTTTENIIVFKATLQDPDNDQVKLEIELLTKR